LYKYVQSIVSFHTFFCIKEYKWYINCLVEHYREMVSYDIAEERIGPHIDRFIEGLREKLDEYSLEYSLSQVFSPKQKELFKKKLEGKPFTKTDQEYYSRTVKKKVVALANSELNALARKLLEY